MPRTTVSTFDPEALAGVRTRLADLLREAVDDGASVGFLAPLSEDDAVRYWLQQCDEVAAGRAVALVALDDEDVEGCVLLRLAQAGNATHRAEIAKLLVH